VLIESNNAVKVVNVVDQNYYASPASIQHMPRFKSLSKSSLKRAPSDVLDSVNRSGKDSKELRSNTNYTKKRSNVHGPSRTETLLYDYFS